MGALQSLRSRVGEAIESCRYGRGPHRRASHWPRKPSAPSRRLVDMVQAISAFQNQQTGYDAALKCIPACNACRCFQYLGN
jgi:flagellar hook-associated protein 3 FlgL